MAEELNFRDIKTKRPWGRVVPSMESCKRSAQKLSEAHYPDNENLVKICTQADFMREYDPHGHLINSEEYYPNIYRSEVVEVVDENGNPIMDSNGNPVTKVKYYEEHVPRWAFAFQQIIAISQIVHVIGNDVQFDALPNAKVDELLLNNIRGGWLSKNMEIATYESISSIKITGDTAFVGFMDNGKFGWQVLTYRNGDTLYPHYRNGKLYLFARSYYAYDEEGNKVTNFLEIWDEKNMSLYRQDIKKNNIVEKIKGWLGLSGYKKVSETAHGFSRIPIAYYRAEEGACWSPSQDTIDNYELDFSQMSQNNHAYGEPILTLQGDDVAAVHDLNGSVKVLTMGQDDKADYLQSQSAAESYMRELDKAYELIFLQSHTVLTPKISGNSDISGAALKVLYADAFKKATTDCQDYQKFMDDMFAIFREGYGIEKNNVVDYQNAEIYAWLKPYMFLNESSIVGDLVQAVSSGFCSKETASKRIPFYTETDEWDKIIRENKEEQQADLLYQLKSAQAQNATENN